MWFGRFAWYKECGKVNTRSAVRECSRAQQTERMLTSETEAPVWSGFGRNLLSTRDPSDN